MCPGSHHQMGERGNRMCLAGLWPPQHILSPRAFSFLLIPVLLSNAAPQHPVSGAAAERRTRGSPCIIPPWRPTSLYPCTRSSSSNLHNGVPLEEAFQLLSKCLVTPKRDFFLTIPNPGKGLSSTCLYASVQMLLVKDANHQRGH